MIDQPTTAEDRKSARHLPLNRAEQIEEYLDLLLALDRDNPSTELHDRIEHALAADKEMEIC